MILIMFFFMKSFLFFSFILYIRAAAGVAHGPLEQRAAQDLPGHRQLADERLARLDDLVSRHLDK